MYTNGIPCADCARAVIQAGIKEVVYHEGWNNNNDPKWKESCDIGNQLMLEAGVKIRPYVGELLDIIPWRKGKRYTL